MSWLKRFCVSQMLNAYKKNILKVEEMCQLCKKVVIIPMEASHFLILKKKYFKTKKVIIVKAVLEQTTLSCYLKDRLRRGCLETLNTKVYSASK